MILAANFKTYALEKLIGAMELKKEIGYRDFKLGVFW